MCAQFTDDDVGKDVVNENGDTVGIVADVDHGTAHVKPDPGITDTIKAKLGWQGADSNAFPLQEAAVARVTDDAIRLEGDLGDTGTTAAGTGTETGATSTDTGAGSEPRMDTEDAAGAHEGTTGEMGTDDRRRDDELIDSDDDIVGSDDDEIIDTDDDSGLMDDDDDSGLRDDDDEIIDTDDDGIIDDNDDSDFMDDDDSRDGDDDDII